MTQTTNYRQEPLSLKEEFHIKNFGLDHHTPQDFFRSQWQTELISDGFLVYRWSLAIFFGIGVISYLIIYFKRGVIFIYLTTWSFILCGITSLSGAIFVTVHHKDVEQMPSQTFLMQCYWALYWTNLVLALVTSIMYWTCIFPKEPPLRPVTRVYNIWTHALPPIIFTVDHFIVAHPSRLLHFLYPLVLSIAYVAFTYIYHKLEGLNALGLPYVYSMLNFKKPGQSFKTIAMVGVVLICSHVLQYGIYRLRVIIARAMDKLQ